MSCERENLQCGNPCSPAPRNTAARETEASKVDNFTSNFFGDVVKTEVDGVVGWSLPCRLDTGLAGEPRGVTEPLACYFMRMFADGITGPTGPRGVQGFSGRNGNSSYVVSLAPFLTPGVNGTVKASLSFNPAIIPGVALYDFVSGWYRVDAIDGIGGVTLKLEKLVANPVGVVPSGTLLVLSGEPGTVGATGTRGGAGNQGPVGPQGVTGVQGNAGTNGKLAVNKFYGLAPAAGLPDRSPVYISGEGFVAATGHAGDPWAVPTYQNGVEVYTTIVGSNLAHSGVLTDAYLPQITLPNIGTYLVAVKFWPFLHNVGSGGGVTSAVIEGRLFNVSTSAPIAGSTVRCTTVVLNDKHVPASIMAPIITTKVNDVVGLGTRLISIGGAYSTDPNNFTYPAVRWHAWSVVAVQIV